MGKFQRAITIAFALAALLGTSTLAAAWFAWEPTLPLVTWAASMPWFFAAETILLGITAVGLAVILIRAVTAPAKKSQLTLKRENGTISFTQNAVQSTVKHVVESYQGLTVSSVRAEIKGARNPQVSVLAKIDPGRNAELGSLGAQLQTEIASTLSAFTGYPTKSVDIIFVGNADVVTSAFTAKAASDATKPGEPFAQQEHPRQQKRLEQQNHPEEQQTHSEAAPFASKARIVPMTAAPITPAS